MKRSRSIIIILSLAYLTLVSALVLHYQKSGQLAELRSESQGNDQETRIFCYDQADQTFEEEDRDKFQDISSAARLEAESHLEADLDGDRVAEQYDFKSGQLTISEGDKTLWQSPDDWRIEDLILADANNDTVTDINLSVWKPGEFGALKPLTVEENDMSVKNHFFIFDLQDDNLQPVWQSSNLSAPNCRFLLTDVNQDGENELVALEGDYADPVCAGKYLSVWKWHEWGFLNEWRSGEGNFQGLGTYDRDGRRCFAGI